MLLGSDLIQNQRVTPASSPNPVIINEYPEYEDQQLNQMRDISNFLFANYVSPTLQEIKRSLRIREIENIDRQLVFKKMTKLESSKDIKKKKDG